MSQSEKSVNAVIISVNSPSIIMGFFVNTCAADIQVTNIALSRIDNIESHKRCTFAILNSYVNNNIIQRRA